MLTDRPDMRGVLAEDSPVMDWIIAAFNGEQAGERIYWNADTPSSGRPAEHLMAWHEYPAAIRITGGSEITPTDKWAGVIFEIFNLENSSDFQALTTRAMAGELDGPTFASRCVELEFKALQKASGFFAEHPLPTSKHKNDIYYRWISADLGSFEEYQQAFLDAETDAATSNFAYFEAYYEQTIRPYIEARQ